MENLVKIIFTQQLEDGTTESEGMWCFNLDGVHFEVNNIPIVMDSIALGDIVTAKYDEVDKVCRFAPELSGEEPALIVMPAR